MDVSNPEPSVQEVPKDESIPEVDITAEASKIYQEITTNASKLTEKIKAMTARVENGEFETSKGLSFLEMRNMMLLQYNLDLTAVVGTKTRCETLDNHPAIRRLVETRTVIEKMKPIHFKLKYLIDKLVKAATIEVTNDNDPMSFKPNPGNIVLEEVEDETEDVQDKGKKKSGKYVPPKVSAVHFEEEVETPDTRKAKLLERAKKRAMSSSLMHELRSEFDDTPEEISEVSVGRKKVNRKKMEQERFEEDNFVRLNVTKKSKKAENEFLTMSGLADNVTSFGDLSALDDAFRDDDSDGNPKKKSRSNGKGRKKNKSVKKKFMKRKSR